jgi:hypothetical protein
VSSWRRFLLHGVAPVSLVVVLAAFGLGWLRPVYVGLELVFVALVIIVAGVSSAGELRDPNRELWPELRKRWAPLREQVGGRVPEAGEPSPAWAVVDVYLEHQRTVSALTCVRYLWGLTLSDAKDLLRARAAARSVAR